MSAMPLPDTAGDLAGRTVSERVGNKAKCSFLLSVLSGDTATTSDRRLAVASLVDDLETIAGALDPHELAQVLDVLEEAIQAKAAEAVWSRTLYPDEAISGTGAIDGTNVQRIVVPPTSSAATSIDVARVDVPRNGRLTVVSEYTFLSDDRAMLEVVDEATDRVLGVAGLEHGHSRVAVCSVEADNVADVMPMLVRVTNESEAESVLWYQSTIFQAETPHEHTVDQLLQESLKKKRVASSASSVFTPVTGEPLTLSDVDRLNALRNKFWGERVFVMGNGPSLNQTPLDLLENDYVFGVNRISLLFDRVSWRPTFFTAFDIRVVPDNRDEFADVDIPYKFFSARYKGMLGEHKDHYWYHTKGHYQGFEASFDPTVVYSGFGGGGTIGVIALELAFFMGFREIYLIGTDVSYSIPKTVKQAGPDEFGDGVKLELQSTQDDDQNHFDPRYFGKDKKWHNPNVREMKIGFGRAAAYIERRGGMLRNATVGGELTEVERVDFTSLF